MYIGIYQNDKLINSFEKDMPRTDVENYLKQRNTAQGFIREHIEFRIISYYSHMRLSGKLIEYPIYK